MITLDKVQKKLSNDFHLGPIQLQIAEGTTHVLVGPSGCGKSTLLRLISRILVPDGGRLTISGKNLAEFSLGEFARTFGYVIQDGGLFPHLTAEENVTLMAKRLGWNQQRCQERVRELSNLVSLSGELLKRYPRQISGGQRQRVALMRALMLDPPLILLDEPLGSLDPLVRSELQKDLKEIFQKVEKTVVWVTHDLFEADFVADQVTLVYQGQIVQTGEYQDLIEHPATPFVKRFTGAFERKEAVGVRNAS